MATLLYRSVVHVPNPPGITDGFRTIVVSGSPLIVGKDGSVWDVVLGQPLNTYKDKDGYLCANKKGLSIKIHRLVLFAFIGGPKHGQECRHLDGNPANNTLENIVWDSKTANRQDRVTHGTHNDGSKHGRAKLTEEMVMVIRSLLETNTNEELATIYDVSVSTISHIRNGRTWTHV